MNFVVHYDIAAIVLSVTVMVHYYMREKIRTKTSDMFRLLMWVNLLACILDFGTGLMINASGMIPNGVQYFLNMLYCSVVYGRTPIYLAYVIYATKGSNVKWGMVDYIQVYAMFLIQFVLVLSTPMTQLIFYFDASGNYHHGPWFNMLYNVTIIYLLLALIRAYRYRTTLERTQVVIVLIYTTMSIVAILIEMVTKEYLIVQFVASLAILLICFTMENPEDYVDKKLGIFNRVGFLMTLSGMMNKKKGFRIMGVSVKGLKYMNETIGVDNSDVLLKEVSEFLVHVGGTRHVFRMSNSRFAIIYENKNESEDCLVDTIQTRFGKPFMANGMAVSLEASMAVLHYPEDAETIDNLIDLLDYATNEAAQSEKQVIIRANEELLKKKRREGQVLRVMKDALRENGFEVFYQPIYSVLEKRYTAAEALIRMPNTELGFISPEEFIPIAEKNGMILEIGEFVFRTVCEFMVREKIWEKGIEHIHVNLSVVQCMQERLAHNFLEIMRENNLPCNRINLEVTETAAVISSESLSMNMHKLVEEGVQFALDDYGTGFSNATSLIEYPYHTIKIDKGVVWAAMENENAMKVLTHSVAMIKSLKMDIVAEGVETLEQAVELSDMGCDYFQGYYYSKPINETAFVELLNKNCA